MLRSFFVSCVALFGTASCFGAEDDSAEPIEPYELVMIPADVSDAKKLMKVYDVDEDSLIDEKEQQRLRWRDSVDRYDFSKDNKLCHLEVALRFAFLRREHDIIEIDRNLADKHLRRFDRDRNGRLDRNELDAWVDRPENADANSDGVASVHELAAAFAFIRGLRTELGIQGVDQGGALKLLNRYDKDGDRKLNSDEAQAAPLPLATKDFDEDSDGLLSTMELATMLAKQRMKLGLSKQDQLNARATFAQFDRDRDGFVTKLELEAIGITEAEIKQILESDTNNDGKLVLAEVETKFAEERKRKGYMDNEAAQAQAAIKRNDADQDGKLQRGEFAERPSLGQIDRKLFNQIDLNRDGNVDLDELAKHFAGLKKN